MLKHNGSMGSHLSVVCEDMIELAKNSKQDVYCEFNGIMLSCDEYMLPTDIEELYSNQMDLRGKRYRESDEYKESQIREKEEKKRVEDEQSVPIRMFELKVPQEEYNSWKDKNKDGYGAYTFKCAEKWAEVMEDNLVEGSISSEDIKKASHNCYTNGGTGAQMSMALSILKQCWKYGDLLPDSIYNM